MAASKKSENEKRKYKIFSEENYIRKKRRFRK